MKLIDGSILRYKKDGDTWIYCKGKEINITHPLTVNEASMTYEHVSSFSWDLFWLPEGLL